MPVTVISNSKNIGFPAAINQGLKAARGEYLVLLNNDAVVTDGWLSQLIALAEIGTGTTRRNRSFRREQKRHAHTRMKWSRWREGCSEHEGNEGNEGEKQDRLDRADVELCIAAATGGECAIYEPGRHAGVCAAVARRAARAVVHDGQAVGVLLAHEASRL